MNMRVLWGGLVGGVVLFAWSAVAHMFTPLGEMGIQSVAKEEPVLEAMRANITAPGMYYLPGIAPGQHNDEAAMKAWEEKAKRGPVALVVYQVQLEGAMTPKQFGTEFVSNLVVGLLAGIVLANLGGSFLMRTISVGLMGAISSVDVYVSYWNWFRFPGDYTMAQVVIQVVGFLLMGAAMAAIIKKQ